ncbi:MAG: tail fiber domain-containing protein [Muribaculaceae bacterium]|nr:tail fiber domain-containing protein [Muribaculaceae bacterium]
MKNHVKLLAVIICLLVTTNQVSAQLIIRNNGHAEIGANPDLENDPDTVTTLKLFGENGVNPTPARITFGDIPLSGYNVVIGEMSNDNTNKLWLHGANGVYFTRRIGDNNIDTLMYYDSSHSTTFSFNSDVQVHGVFIQSDEHFKEDIEPVEDVLSALTTLEPVTYRLKSHRASTRPMGLTESDKDREVMDRFYQSLEQGSERYGFLAQNVKEAFPQLVHTDADGYMSVDYIGLIPILVQSINELRAELAEVKGESEKQEAPAIQSPLQSSLEELGLSSAKLYQNAPNPWSSETVIRYSLPQTVVSADIYIYDLQGKQLKRIAATGRGESQVSLTAHGLNAGMYLYALVADGTLIDSKKMILTK